MGRASRVPHVGFKKAVEFVVGALGGNRTPTSWFEARCSIHYTTRANLVIRYELSVISLLTSLYLVKEFCYNIATN